MFQVSWLVHTCWHWSDQTSSQTVSSLINQGSSPQIIFLVYCSHCFNFYICLKRMLVFSEVLWHVTFTILLPNHYGNDSENYHDFKRRQSFTCERALKMMLSMMMLSSNWCETGLYCSLQSRYSERSKRLFCISPHSSHLTNHYEDILHSM